MKIPELKRMEMLESFYWWFVARRELAILLLKQYLSNDNDFILDIGCGTGAFLKELSKLTKYASGLDISSYAIESCFQKGLENLYIGDVTKMDFNLGSFDFITALDIFEHVEDDRKALGECFRVLKSKGRILLTVPTLNLLWSQHDIALEHKRRYAISELKEKLTATGFKIERITYCMFFLFLPVFIFYFLQNCLVKSTSFSTTLSLFPRPINRLLTFLLRIENLLISVGVNFPLGVSIICMARKP